VTKYQSTKEVESFDFSAEDGTVHFVDSSLGMHKLENPNEELSVSLHLYSPPYLECRSGRHSKPSVVPYVYCQSPNNNKAPLLEGCLHDHSLKLKHCPGHVFCNFHTTVELLSQEFKSGACARTISKMLQSLQFNPREWISYVRFDKKHYTRFIIARTTKFSLMLTCWEAGQSSPIHDHNGARTWIKVLEGELHETQYKLATIAGAESLEISQENELTDETIAYRDGTVIHKNESASETVISLHVYSPPYSECHCYEMDGKSRLVQTSTIISE